jgi:hypothetical protein
MQENPARPRRRFACTVAQRLGCDQPAFFRLPIGLRTITDRLRIKALAKIGREYLRPEPAALSQR